ncbi:hypothetical protein NHQ30_002685 [Ciborinia camelliae]|nr:hypothetical protein NHQ30_002685 [Ciborinia camelliae]
MAFKPEGKRWGETSTYRGSIQLHASSWPKTDLTPWRPRRANVQIEQASGLLFLITLETMRLLRNDPTGADHMWPHSDFWDFSAEDFLATFNADVRAGGVATSRQKMSVMSREDLDDMLWHLASTSPSWLTWGPIGIIRRIPLTGIEWQEIINERATMDDIILPKGRGLVDWDGDYEALCEWDDKSMPTSLEFLERDTGITYTAAFQAAQQAIQDADDRMLQLAMDQAAAYEKLVAAYLASHPGCGPVEAFTHAFFPAWKADNPDGSRREAQLEFQDAFMEADPQAGKLDLAALVESAGGLPEEVADACPSQ